jgi:hypothetical protein
LGHSYFSLKTSIPTSINHSYLAWLNFYPQFFSVANLRCTPNKAALRSIVQDFPTKRFIVHPEKNRRRGTKKSNIEESGDAAKTVAKAFKS